MDATGGSRRRRRGSRGSTALWWPPTKIAGRYLSPYLAVLDGADPVDEAARPDGHPVGLDLERDPPATADALRQASLRGDEERARLAQRRAEARSEQRSAEKLR